MDQNNSENVFEPTVLEVGITKINLKGTAVPLVQVLEEIAPQGERTKKTLFIGQPIVIHAVRPFMGEYGPALFVIFTDQSGELFNTIISNRILMPKLLTVRDHLPVSCTIVQKEREGKPSYYDFE